MAKKKPSRLDISIGGFMGESISVLLERGALRYESYSGGYALERTATVSPTDEQWCGFRAALDSLKVWRWSNEYILPVCDGTQWGVEVVWDDDSVKSHGSNCYPKANGQPNGTTDQTPTFRKFLDAVSTLLEGLPFH